MCVLLTQCASPAALRAPVPRTASARPCNAQRASLQAARPAAAAAGRQRRQACRAAAENKEGSPQSTQQQQGAPAAPDTPPAPSGAGQQQQQQQGAAEALGQAQNISIEEIQQRAAQMRQQQQQEQKAEGKGGLFEGVMEEVQLIKWPAPVKALVQTLLVIGIVAGTAAALLAINSTLAELSKLL